MPGTKYGLGADKLESSFPKKDLRVLLDKLIMTQQCILAGEIKDQ